MHSVLLRGTIVNRASLEDELELWKVQNAAACHFKFAHFNITGVALATTGLLDPIQGASSYL